jgi:hypothetical protein
MIWMPFGANMLHWQQEVKINLLPTHRRSKRFLK